MTSKSRVIGIFGGTGALGSALSKKWSKKIKVKTPQRGWKKDLLDTAIMDAIEIRRVVNFRRRTDLEFRSQSLEQLKNNLGLKKVTTKYALILNPDATLHSSTLENFLKAVKQIPKFAIMGPYIQDKKNNNEKNYLKNSNPMPAINVKGFAMFLNLSEFKDIGFFDENFFFYFEEIDLCKRLVDRGKKIYLVPDIKINHDGGQSHEESINKEMELSRNWHWMWSTFNYHKKYKGFFVSFFIILPKMISAIIKVLIYTLTFNKKKKIYYQRLSGLINAIMGKSSWYRPKV